MVGFETCDWLKSTTVGQRGVSDYRSERAGYVFVPNAKTPGGRLQEAGSVLVSLLLNITKGSERDVRVCVFFGEGISASH